MSFVLSSRASFDGRLQYSKPKHEIPKDNNTDQSACSLVHPGLYPEDSLEAAFADAAVDSLHDSNIKLIPILREKDKVKQVQFGSTVYAAHATC